MVYYLQFRHGLSLALVVLVFSFVIQLRPLALLTRYLPFQFRQWSAPVTPMTASDPTESLGTAMFTANPDAPHRVLSINVRRAHDAHVMLDNVAHFERTFGILPELDVRPKAEFVDVLDRSHCGSDSAWGFVAFRTTYGNDTNWATFKQHLESMIEAQFDQASQDYERTGVQKWRSKWTLSWVEDKERLDGVGFEEVRLLYQSMVREEEQNPDGRGLLGDLHANEVLVIDAKSMHSVIAAASVVRTPYRDRLQQELNFENNHVPDDGLTPFIYVVELDDEDEGREEGDMGYLKGAVAGLINEIWPTLGGDVLPTGELVVPIERIWRYFYKADTIQQCISTSRAFSPVVTQDGLRDTEAMVTTIASNDIAPIRSSSEPRLGESYTVDHVMELPMMKYFITAIIHNDLQSGLPLVAGKLDESTWLGPFQMDWSTLGVPKNGNLMSTFAEYMGSFADDTNLQVLEASIRGLKARVWGAVPSLISVDQYRSLRPEQRLGAMQSIIGVFKYMNTPVAQTSIQKTYMKIRAALSNFDTAAKSKDLSSYDTKGAWKEFTVDVSRNMAMNAQVYLLRHIPAEKHYWYGLYNEGDLRARAVLQMYDSLSEAITTSCSLNTSWV